LGETFADRSIQLIVVDLSFCSSVEPLVLKYFDSCDPFFGINFQHSADQILAVFRHLLELLVLEVKLARDDPVKNIILRFALKGKEARNHNV